MKEDELQKQLQKTVEEWKKEAQEIADRLSPKARVMLSGQLEVEILHWAVSMESSFTLLLYDAGRPLSLLEILLEGIWKDVQPREWNALSCLAALQKRGWLSVRGDEYGLTPTARRLIEEVAGKGEYPRRWGNLDEWMMHNPAKPIAKE